MRLCLLNRNHPFVQWLLRVRDACEQNAYGLREEQFERLLRLLDTPVRHDGFELKDLVAYLDGWRKLPDLPPDLYPPANPTADMFVMKRPADSRASESD